MPNGRESDHPFSDLLDYGHHPFPADVEDLVRAIARIDRSALVGFDLEPFRWERGEDLDEGRERLRALLHRLERSADR